MAIVSRTAESDGVATIDWSEILAQHRRWLRAVVVARLGGVEGSDEVLQEVALAAVRQHAPLADAEKAAPWLYRLAVVQSLLYRRRHGRQRKLVHRYAHVAQPSEADGGVEPLDWILADERRQMVRDAISEIPPRDAEILLLKYTQGWSYRQLADHLGISESAVETRLHRARSRLRHELSSKWGVTADA